MEEFAEGFNNGQYGALEKRCVEYGFKKGHYLMSAELGTAQGLNGLLLLDCDKVRELLLKSEAKLKIAVEALEKIEKTECSGIVGKRWCCQFRQWADEALSKLKPKDKIEKIHETIKSMDGKVVR